MEEEIIVVVKILQENSSISILIKDAIYEEDAKEG